MRFLEKNGYHNVGGLKRVFAIEVNNCKDKEELLHSLFSRNVVGDSELFSLDVQEVASLLSSFDGKQIFPKNEDKDQVNEEFLDAFTVSQLPDGIYKIESFKKGINAKLEKKGTKIIIKKDSKISQTYNFTESTPSYIKARKELKLAEDGITLCEDYSASGGLSAIASIVYGSYQNGWKIIKDLSGNLIDTYRKRQDEDN